MSSSIRTSTIVLASAGALFTGFLGTLLWPRIMSSSLSNVVNR